MKAPNKTAFTNSSKRPDSNERGTDKAPLAVKLLNTGKSEQEASQEAAQIQNENNAEWWVRVLTAALVGVGLLQLFAYIIQARRLKQTIGVMHDTAERQLRAYLTVLTGRGAPQD